MTLSKKTFKKKFKKKEELPSFLKDLVVSREEYITPPEVKSKHYLGPIFFGEFCKHPPPHAFTPTAVRQHQKLPPDCKDDIADLFLGLEKKVEKQKPHFPRVKNFRPVIKHKKKFYDVYPHKCPGNRKVFLPSFKTPKIDLGKTTSIIEGETTMEVPLCRFRRVSSDTSETELEFVFLSDLREERRKYMSYKEQISHSHYPKQFVNVTINGPTIPASLTITKLPCKRPRAYDDAFLKKSESDVKKDKEVIIEEEHEEFLQENDSEELGFHLSGDEIASEFSSNQQSEKIDSIIGSRKSQRSDYTDEKYEEDDSLFYGVEESFEMAGEFSETETEGEEMTEAESLGEETQEEENLDEGQEERI